ncbi:TetR/AcrR family transcriptional regulator [Nocardia cyriacigeorgica]|uniref:TetR/AcrR family transcriptional regulator n=1 Tax=Nocardia cyriacigeorgica TaxID=135487 RepID=A0A6P1DCD4_9NOCA|nr:TetR family transcriptional regulator [Nocardia cyriacigeorgica]NEW40021.1 TetR/AcrR family transcriptional regulator [Nocardia cyriacigeorgica]NEW46824.1 TetR/AcrR family transcriptional regulator [Nocardia cyriacigeorgica]NEW53635.1 TetR/AcrR family transcriptional regulator [Nocardia cyriacigeorgica]NEW58343.1 TetR/AcrR family transcriptional regulator [Nocardia cyriacigeorgica]
MPRIAEARDAAAPSSTEQHARVQRILEAAVALATEHELERVQMNEVAKLAGVAVATLYRYFPSKTHLFVAVMVDQIDQMSAGFARRPRPGLSATAGVHDTLVRVVRALLRRPLLANAMIQSNSAAKAALVPDTARVERNFRQLLYDAAGIEEATERDATLVRVLIHAAFGVIQSCLNGRITVPDAEQDLRVMCDLLLAEWPESFT